MSSSTFDVSCPTCKKSVKWCKENEFRPFCTERCKMIDLGEWSSEGYSIPDESPTNALEAQDEVVKCH